MERSLSFQTRHSAFCCFRTAIAINSCFPRCSQNFTEICLSDCRDFSEVFPKSLDQLSFRLHLRDNFWTCIIVWRYQSYERYLRIPCLNQPVLIYFSIIHLVAASPRMLVINFWMLVVNGFTAIFSSCINNFCWFYMLILRKGMLNFCMKSFLRIGSNYSRIQVFVNANFLFFCNKKLTVSKLKWNKHVAYGSPCFTTCGMLEERII